MVYGETLRLSASGADNRFVAMALEGVAECLPDSEAGRSAMLLGAAETLRGVPLPGTGVDRVNMNKTVARLRAALGDAAYDEAIEGGRRLSVEEAIDLADPDSRT